MSSGDLMLRRALLFASVTLVAVGLVAATTPVTAQWLKYPTAGIPRTPDGKPNLKAPTPRTGDGKPDFSGMWLTADGPPCPQNTSGQDFIECGIELPISVLGFNMGVK